MTVNGQSQLRGQGADVSGTIILTTLPRTAPRRPWLKKAASMAVLLEGTLLMGADTLIVTGATTFGCLRAPVVDGVQSGLNVLVACNACADRAQPSDEVNLCDMNQQNADVPDTGGILVWIGTLQPRK